MLKSVKLMNPERLLLIRRVYARVRPLSIELMTTRCLNFSCAVIAMALLAGCASSGNKDLPEAAMAETGSIGVQETSLAQTPSSDRSIETSDTVAAYKKAPG